ncbi:MAG: hypothetical protein B6245_03935 [Desulfobacteraceae bacterium 4572_88]|nr:MAG: hypothetical protein B6245_03935 [Desulfobacteraceae bacterium 4572_88]
MFSKRTVIITGVIMLFAFCVIGLSLSGKRGRTSYGSGAAIYFVAPFQKGFTRLKKSVPVVIPEGVVGLVTDISTHYSKVLLLVDQNSAVDALVQRTRARGIIKGGTAGRCLFKYVLRKHDIVESDIVVSSGLDGVFPKGLRVGTVSNVTRRNSGIFQEVTVIPYVDFEKLEEVLVILNLPRYAPAYYDHFKSGVSER